MRNRRPFSVLSILLGSLFLWLGCHSGGDGSPALTTKDRQKITELVLSVAEDPEDTIKPAREELWSILGDQGSLSAASLGHLQTRFMLIGEGHRLFWLDAREALRIHRPVISAERARWEERLTRDGWLSELQRGRFEALMKRVVDEEPIPSNHGVEVSLSPEMVEEIVNSWDEGELRRSVAYLLKPPD
jgi:hypothetical protein